MKHRLTLLGFMLFLGFHSTALALSVLWPLPPGHSEQGGFVFDIIAKPSVDGAMQVHVVLTEKTATFIHPTTHLGKVIITDKPGSRQEEVERERDIPHTKNEKSLTCDFTVPEKELADSNLCFVFTNYAPHNMPSADFFYARLSEIRRNFPAHQTRTPLHFVGFVFASSLVGLLGGWLAYHVVKALRTGVANASGTAHQRSARPRMFWLSVGVQAAFACLSFATLAWNILRSR